MRLVIAVFLLLASALGCKGGGAVAPQVDHTIATGGHYEDPVWSADGQLIAVTHSEHGVTRLEVLDATGNKLRTLPRDDKIPSDPGWQDSDIVFLDGKVKPVLLRLASPDGVRTLADVSGSVRASWSRDGQWGVLHRMSITDSGLPDSGDSKLLLLNLQSLKLQPIQIPRLPRQFGLSPSGRYLAFVDHDTSSAVVMVKDLKSDTATAKALWRVPHADGVLADLAWLPDERRIGVRRTRGKADGFYILDREGQTCPWLLTTLDLVYPDWSPVGDRIVYVTVGSPGSNELHVLHLPSDWMDGIPKDAVCEEPTL